MSKLVNVSISVLADGCFPPYNEGTSKYTWEDRILLTSATSLIITTVIVLGFIKSRNQFLACFDARRHFRSIFDTEIKPGEITYFHGLRVCTIFSVVLFHSFAIRISNIEPHTATYEEWALGRHFIKLYLPSTVVDIFFVMSSILATRAVLKHLRKGTYNYFLSIMSRYFRITVMIMFILLINNFLSATLKSSFDCYDASCQRWWWKTILLIQNIFVDVRKEQLCLLWLWYVAVDFHMFMIAPALTYLLWKYGQKMVPLAAAIAFIGVMYRFHILSTFGDDWIMKNLFDDYLLSQQLVVFQFQTSMRFAPYIFGVIFGFYIDRMEANKSNLNGLPRILFILFWIIPFALMGGLFIIIYSDVTLILPEHMLIMAYPFIDLIYKVFVSLSVGWATLSCYFGSGGFINKMMSCRFFRIASKFSFGVYLIHYIIQLLVVHHKMEYSTYELSEMVSEVTFEIGLSVLFAMFCLVFIELPVGELNTMLMTGRKTVKILTTDDNNNRHAMDTKMKFKT